MGYSLEFNNESSKWEWDVYAPGFGLVMGTAESLDEAKVRIMIAEFNLYEVPIPQETIEQMLANPSEYITSILKNDILDLPI